VSATRQSVWANLRTFFLLAVGSHDGGDGTDRGRLAAGSRGCALSRSDRMERSARDRVRGLSHLYSSGRASCGARCKVDAAQATIEFVSGRLAFAPDHIAEPTATVTAPADDGHRVGELDTAVPDSLDGHRCLSNRCDREIARSVGRMADRVCAELERIVGEPVSFGAREVDALERDPSGKRSVFVCAQPGSS
jgi:hypothetical protein